MAWDGIRAHMFTSLPALVDTASPDGHTVQLKLAIKQLVAGQNFDSTNYQDYTVIPDVPIHFPGAGGSTMTHALKAGDEILTVFSSRALDAWHQSGGSQPQSFNRLFSLADAMAIPGMRSDPRKLQQVSGTSTQIRSDDKHHVVDHDPSNGTTIKSVDPSTQAASDSFDPFTAAKKFFSSIVHPTDGISHNATDSDTTHSITNDHTAGPKLSAANGEHTVNAHPTNGVGIISSIAHTIGAPNINLDKLGNLSSLKSLAALFGSIGGMSFGAGGGAAGQGNLAMTGSVAGAVLQTSQMYTVATLPTPTMENPAPDGMAAPGTRAAVSDATGTTFYSVLMGGGSYNCPAYCTGTSWVVG